MPKNVSPQNDTLIEIFAAQREFLVAVNESGVPLDGDDAEYGGTIWWNGRTYAEARVVARELLDDFGGRIVDLVTPTDQTTVQAAQLAHKLGVTLVDTGPDCPF